jgi:beta-lactam-binding protein with PASTA domain
MEVPDVRGQPVHAAHVGVAASGLSSGRTETVFCAGNVSGMVFEQRPLAGERVGRGSMVDLLVCRDRGLDTWVMPDLVYRDYDEVRRRLVNRGLRFGSIKFEPYEGVAEGVVLRQFPLAGHPLQSKDVISLVVATSERLIP